MANLLPEISFETGWVRGYLKSDGDIGYDVNDDMTSPFVAVNSGDSYTFSVNYDLPSPHAGWIALVQYDAGKRMIGSRYTKESSSSNLPSSITLTTSSDCKYIRVTSSNLENNSSATASLEGNSPEPTWIVGEDGYPTPANSETALPDYTFVKPLPRLLWHCSEITMDILPDLPSYALTEPLPRSMWRITARVENGYPYHELFPDLIRQSGAFENASRLSRVVIPESVKVIGDTAFSGTALTVVRVAADCTFGESSFPENCRILRYPAHTHGQLTDSSGRAVLDRQGRRIYARRNNNG